MAFKGLAKDEFQKISAETASRTIKAIEHGTLFTNRGAGGAIVLTLPAIADVQAGWFIDYMVVADQTVTITAPANKQTLFNNATATSLAWSTASEKIGSGGHVVFDGTTYLHFVNLGIETATPVVS